MSRFQKRRRDLIARKRCVRCTTGKPKDGCHHCPECLAVIAAKRLTDPLAEQRRRDRVAARKALLLEALTHY